MVATVGALAQGSLTFANKAAAATPALDAPIFNTDGVTKLGAGFTAQIYAGTSADSLSPTALTTPFKANGYFSGGKVLLPGFAEGSAVWIKIAAFDSSGGKTSYADALAANLATGMSANAFKITLGGDNLVPPATPAFLTGMESFKLTIVPEPSTIALGALAAGALLLFRRK